MDPGIQTLEVAIGIKDLLMNAGFTTVDSLVRLSPAELAAILGIEFYVAKIIRDAAKKAVEQREDYWEANTPNTAPQLTTILVD